MIRSKWTLSLCLVSWNIFLLVFVIHRFNLFHVHVGYFYNFFRTMLQRYTFDMKLAYYRRQNVLCSTFTRKDHVFSHLFKQ